MSIPSVQSRLRELAVQCAIPELARLADELSRRRAIRRAPPTARRMSNEVRDEIRTIAALNPKMPFASIAAQVGVNPGRVSETLSIQTRP